MAAAGIFTVAVPLCECHCVTNSRTSHQHKQQTDCTSTASGSTAPGCLGQQQYSLGQPLQQSVQLSQQDVCASPATSASIDPSPLAWQQMRKCATSKKQQAKALGHLKLVSSSQVLSHNRATAPHRPRTTFSPHMHPWTGVAAAPVRAQIHVRNNPTDHTFLMAQLQQGQLTSPPAAASQQHTCLPRA